MCKNLFGEESHTRRRQIPRTLDEALDRVSYRAKRVEDLVAGNPPVTVPAIRLSAFSLADDLRALDVHLADKILTSRNSIAVSRVRDAVTGLWKGYKTAIADNWDTNGEEIRDFRDSRELLRFCAAI